MVLSLGVDPFVVLRTGAVDRGEGREIEPFETSVRLCRRQPERNVSLRRICGEAMAAAWGRRAGNPEERKGLGVAKLMILPAMVVLATDVVPAMQQTPASRPSPYRMEPIEEAVVKGSIESLRTIRSRLAAEIGRLDADGAIIESSKRYTLAYVDWRVGQLLDRGAKKARKKLLKAAQGQLDLILEADPTDAEALALRGTTIGDRIEGAFAGMILGPKASKSLDRAAELAPENPRVALQGGIGFFFTPKQFGGGVEKAEAELRRARQLFERIGAGDTWPFWGRVDALAWLGQVLAKTGRREQARSLYEEALAIESGHAWILNELLPALDE